MILCNFLGNECTETESEIDNNTILSIVTFDLEVAVPEADHANDPLK